MDRVACKNKAKEMIKGNKWFIWKPMVYFFLIGLALGAIGVVLDLVCGTDGLFSSIVDFVAELLGAVLGVGYVYYILAFVRGQRLEFKDIVSFAKEHWVVCILTTILVGIITALASILLIIPGIIAALGLTFYSQVIVDNPDLGAVDVVKKSWELTKGYKGAILVYYLSFIGWTILANLTLGILYIWLYPYMVVSLALVYENLKAIQK